MKRKTSKKAKLKGHPGDWMGIATPVGAARKPMGIMANSRHSYDPDETVLQEFRNPTTTPYLAAMEAIREGKAVVDDAWLFCGRFDQSGRFLREGDEPYKMTRVRGAAAYRAAVRESVRAFEKLPDKAAKANARALQEAKARIKAKSKEAGPGFQSNTDAGSLGTYDPNQYTEYTPFFSGPWGKQLYWDYFTMHARAFEQWNHNALAKRIINILSQYALGRGFKVRIEDEAVEEKWKEHAAATNLYHLIRKFWVREYLIYGELMVDVEKWTSIDPSTIWEIVTDDEMDQVLYYQQMFQTVSQTYSGQNVPGVAGAKKSTVGHYIIRQLPYDRVMHIKTECVSNEKRGRSVLFSILGWCKRMQDLYNAQVVGEQLRSSFIFDDLIKGGDADVQTHASRYNYMPPAGSVFAHNEQIERKPMAPMAGVSASRDGVGQEILAIIATALGIPKEHLNVMGTGGGSRATAIVGSEPFTKVIEDLQQDFEDLLYALAEKFCEQEGLPYDQGQWSFIFPSVTKDTTGETLKNYATAESMNWISKRRAATMAAAELEITDYDYDNERKKAEKDAEQALGSALAPIVTPPGGRFGPPKPGAEPDKPGDNPIHGEGKQDIVDQHKSL